MMECLDVAFRHYENQLQPLREQALAIFKSELRRRGLETYIDDANAARLLAGRDGSGQR